MPPPHKCDHQIVLADTLIPDRSALSVKTRGRPPLELARSNRLLSEARHGFKKVVQVQWLHQKADSDQAFIFYDLYCVIIAYGL